MIRIPLDASYAMRVPSGDQAGFRPESPPSVVNVSATDTIQRLSQRRPAVAHLGVVALSSLEWRLVGGRMRDRRARGTSFFDGWPACRCKQRSYRTSVTFLVISSRCDSKRSK